MTTSEMTSEMQSGGAAQRLHLVFGGELNALESHTFKNIDDLDIVGIFPDYATAYNAWKAAAQRTVDKASTRYFIVHLHRLLEPSGETDKVGA